MKDNELHQQREFLIKLHTQLSGEPIKSNARLKWIEQRLQETDRLLNPKPPTDIQCVLKLYF